MSDRILSWFSCGAASAVATKEALLAYGSMRVLPVCCDTRPSEHPDNYRFSAECEKWFGVPIKYLKSMDFETVDEVFERTRYMSGVKGARCTMELKKYPRLMFASARDTHIFGFTADEGKRLREFQARNPALILNNILLDLGITKSDCYQRVKDAGIALPVMYELGFNNNNCPGCVKASSPWYWSHVRKHFPEVFKRRCEQSRALGVRLVEIKHHVRIFLDELPDREFQKRISKKEKAVMSCGPECGVPVK